jgi:hypothetical protein
MVHAAFRREFGALPGLVRNVQAGDIQRSQATGDHIAPQLAAVGETVVRVCGQ